MALRAGVLTVSDGCARGEREDLSGHLLAETLRAHGCEIMACAVTPDDVPAIAGVLVAWCEAGCDLILTTGGTGFAPRDVTPEATRGVIEREAPGLAELLRWTGYQKLPRAVLSRGVAGIRSATLIVNLPGSPGGARDGLDVLLPLLPHAVALLRDQPVDHTPDLGPPQIRAGRGVEGAQEGSDGQGAAESGPAGDRDEFTPVSAGDRAAALEMASEQQEAPAVVVALETNLDDFSPEFYDVLMTRLFAAGAVDVFLTPIQMKKQRPGTLLTALAPPERSDAVAHVIFRETTTLGLRQTALRRLTLQRRWKTVETPYGAIRVKVGRWREEDTTASPEYEDVRAAALAHDVPVKTVYLAAQCAYAALSAQDP